MWCFEERLEDWKDNIALGQGYTLILLYITYEPKQLQNVHLIAIENNAFVCSAATYGVPEAIFIFSSKDTVNCRAVVIELLLCCIVSVHSHLSGWEKCCFLFFIFLHVCSVVKNDKHIISKTFNYNNTYQGFSDKPITISIFQTSRESLIVPSFY